MKQAYKFLGLLIWTAGVLLFIQAMTAGSWAFDGVKAITMLGFAVAAFMSIFSFLYGAQPGHYIRFVMIVLFSILCSLTYLNEKRLFHGGDYRLTMLAVVAVMVIISNGVRKNFQDEFRRSGRVDYFEEYFKKVI